MFRFAIPFLAVLSLAAQTQPRYRSRVVIFNLKDSTTRTLYQADDVVEAPNWSRDGKHLLINTRGKLFRVAVNATDPKPEQLALDETLRCNNDHDYSPDGKLLAFSASSPASRQSQVWVANADGTNARLVVAPTPSYFHGWSPDGKWLAFVAQREGHYSLFRVPVGGGDEQRLTSKPPYDDGPDYSRDGKWIYFNSERGGGWDVWRMPAAGAGADDAKAERVTNDDYEDWFPHPSPDRKHLLMFSFPKGTKGHNDRMPGVALRLMPMPGDKLKPATPRVLTTFFGGQGTINVNSWSPDSKQFAFVMYEPLPAAATGRPRIQGLAHIAVYAKSFEEARAYYHGMLGFEEPYQLTDESGKPSMLFFKINDQQYVEVSPEKAPGGDRLSHIAIETNDAEAMRRYLASRGVKVPDSVPKGRSGNSNFTIQDPEGHSVEIVQYEPTGWSARERGKFMPATRVSQRMRHVGIVVTKFDEEMKFYQDVLGFTETWRGGRDASQVDWVNLKVPDGDDYIELMLYKDAPAPDKRGSAHHLALEVDDAIRSVSLLEQRKGRYPRAMEVRTGINRKRQVNLFDPDGTRSELMEPRTIDGQPAPSSTAPPPGKNAIGMFDNHGDLGVVLHAGSAAFNASRGAYTIAGSGENMWGTADALHFVWKRVSGDRTISAEIAFLGDGGNAHRKAVLMMRQSLDADSVYADAALHGDGLASLQTRAEKGAATHEIQSKSTKPAHLKLTRQGEYVYMTVEGSLSGGWMRVPLTGDYYIGIGVCAHDRDAVERAVFTDVAVAEPKRGEPALYSTIETVKVNSGDRRSAYMTKGRVKSVRWSGEAMEFEREGQRLRVPFEGYRTEPVTEVRDAKAEPGPLPPVSEYRDLFAQQSPDGKKVVLLSFDKSVQGCPEDAGALLRLYTPADGKVKTLAQFEGGCGSFDGPSWSADSTRVAFVSYQRIAPQ